jgi:hypothetical protein
VAPSAVNRPHHPANWYTPNNIIRVPPTMKAGLMYFSGIDRSHVLPSSLAWQRSDPSYRSRSPGRISRLTKGFMASDGKVTHGASGRVAAYGDLVDAASSVPVPCPQSIIGGGYYRARCGETAVRSNLEIIQSWGDAYSSGGVFGGK